MEYRVAIQSPLAVHSGILGQAKQELFVLSIWRDGRTLLQSYKLSDRTTKGKISVDLSTYTKHSISSLRHHVLAIYLSTQKKPLELVASNVEMLGKWVSVLAQEMKLTTCFSVSVRRSKDLLEFTLLEQVSQPGQHLIRLRSALDNRTVADWNIRALTQVTLVMPLNCEIKRFEMPPAKVIFERCTQDVCTRRWPCTSDSIPPCNQFLVAVPPDNTTPVVWSYIQELIMTVMGESSVKIDKSRWPTMHIKHICADDKGLDENLQQKKSSEMAGNFYVESASDEVCPINDPISADESDSSSMLCLPSRPDRNDLLPPRRNIPRPGCRPPSNVPRPTYQPFHGLDWQITVDSDYTTLSAPKESCYYKLPFTMTSPCPTPEEVVDREKLKLSVQSDSTSEYVIHDPGNDKPRGAQLPLPPTPEPAVGPSAPTLSERRPKAHTSRVFQRLPMAVREHAPQKLRRIQSMASQDRQAPPPLPSRSPVSPKSVFPPPLPPSCTSPPPLPSRSPVSPKSVSPPPLPPSCTSPPPLPPNSPSKTAPALPPPPLPSPHPSPSSPSHVSSHSHQRATNTPNEQRGNLPSDDLSSSLLPAGLPCPGIQAPVKSRASPFPESLTAKLSSPGATNTLSLKSTAPQSAAPPVLHRKPLLPTPDKERSSCVEEIAEQTPDNDGDYGYNEMIPWKKVDQAVPPVSPRPTKHNIVERRQRSTPPPVAPRPVSTFKKP